MRYTVGDVRLDVSHFFVDYLKRIDIYKKNHW